MPFFKKEKNDILLDFKLFRFRINTKKNYVVSTNKIIVVNSKTGKETRVQSYPGIEITFKSNNSVVKIYDDTKFSNSKFVLRDDCLITIGQSKYKINSLRILLENNSTVSIGKDFSCFSCSIVSDDEQNKNVKIGKDCMFSGGITLRTSDSHRIYDINNRDVINPGQDIIIGNHVWCGVQVMILKGAEISDCSIIGACSLVNKKFNEKNVIIAGSPAKVIKSSVNWDRKQPDSEVPITYYEESVK